LVSPKKNTNVFAIEQGELETQLNKQHRIFRAICLLGKIALKRIVAKLVLLLCHFNK